MALKAQAYLASVCLENLRKHISTTYPRPNVRLVTAVFLKYLQHATVENSILYEN